MNRYFVMNEDGKEKVNVVACVGDSDLQVLSECLEGLPRNEEGEYQFHMANPSVHEELTSYFGDLGSLVGTYQFEYVQVMPCKTHDQIL